MKYLPLGVQSFKNLRQGDYIYVDKTKWIYELIKRPLGFYFLSRPRRFGKSLLLSTLEALFEGKKELFEGLWIHEQSDYSWEKHPVVMLDFNGIDHETPESLQEDLLETLDEIAEQYEITLSRSSISGKFSNLITGLAKKYGSNVVVLVDEYDKAIVNHLGRGEEELAIAMKNRDILKGLFGVLKKQSVANVLRLVFLTGVSKFSRVSVFGDLNNLEDLTLDSGFCDLLGYTEEELNNYFEPHIQVLAEEQGIDVTTCKEKLKRWYDGYRFTEKDQRMYNPFSILSVLKKRTFKNFWFETGTPTFLVELIKHQDYPIPKLEKLQLGEQSLSTFDVDQLKLEALLFQTGYITIKNHRGNIFELSYPNQEVKTAFLAFLYNYLLSSNTAAISDRFLFLHEYLKDSQYELFIETVNTILSSIPYQHIANRDESWYHIMFYLMLSASGVDVLTEVLVSKGRIDIAVFFEEKTYIIELKCDQDATTAIDQIRDKDYAESYRDPAKTIYLMGINFDSTKRTITDWKREEL